MESSANENRLNGLVGWPSRLHRAKAAVLSPSSPRDESVRLADRTGACAPLSHRMRAFAFGHAIHNFADDFSGRGDFFGGGVFA